MAGPLDVTTARVDPGTGTGRTTWRSCSGQAGTGSGRTSSELQCGGEGGGGGGGAQEEEEETDSIASKLSQVFLSVFLLSCLETKNREELALGFVFWSIRSLGTTRERERERERERCVLSEVATRSWREERASSFFPLFSSSSFIHFFSSFSAFRGVPQDACRPFFWNFSSPTNCYDLFLL
jgi:hypothetical protein